MLGSTEKHNLSLIIDILTIMWDSSLRAAQCQHIIEKGRKERKWALQPLDRKIIKKIIIQTGHTKKHRRRPGWNLTSVPQRSQWGPSGKTNTGRVFSAEMGGGYDAKMEEMCCYSLCLFTDSKQGFKVVYYYRKQALKYDTWKHTSADHPHFPPHFESHHV